MKAFVHPFGRRDGVDVICFAAFLILLLCKVLWGYWNRDLTFGDTSSYFRDAVTWIRSGENNIVWSPLYTAYFGYVWGAFRDVEVAVLFHRLALVVSISALVGWIALCSLPRLLAILVLTWWTALPIHYDTLYEVHLFGSIPLLLLILVGLAAPIQWRYPLWIGICIVSATLIRNEYVILLAVFVGWWLGSWFWLRARLVQVSVRSDLLRLAVGVGAAAALAIFMYGSSYVKGPEKIRQASSPKHTLNMCQVYAFGYQQRHPDWTLDPWTECHGLMEETFGEPSPSLSHMIRSNPEAVLEHFAWNVSLLPAGLELLLFNVVGGEVSPDYTAVLHYPVAPRVVLIVSLAFAAWATIAAVRKGEAQSEWFVAFLKENAPLLVGTVAMVFAVVLTQRPRPSYLLGFGVMLVWFGALAFTAWRRRYTWLDHRGVALAVGGLFLILAPSYSSLSLASKHGELGNIIKALSSHSEALCDGRQPIALSDYSFELSSYLCSPHSDLPRGGGKPVVSVGALKPTEVSDPDTFADSLSQEGVGSFIVDPYLISKFPALESCDAIRRALEFRGWRLLSFQRRFGGNCIAAFVRK